MIDVEVFGAPAEAGAPAAPSPTEVRRLCALTAARLGIEDGHVAVEFVDGERIAELNAAHRGLAKPTDVLSFPIDGVEPHDADAADLHFSGHAREPDGPPRELGDIVISPAHTSDLREAIVHGMLHLLGMDHERDDGKMLSLQRELLIEASR